MMIQGIGTDLTYIPRFERLYDLYGARFINRLFTPYEQAKCESRRAKFESYAKIFSAKEAVRKTIVHLSGVRFLDIEIRNYDNGQPYVTLSGMAIECVSKQIPEHASYGIHLSISDEPPYAQSFALLYYTF